MPPKRRGLFRGKTPANVFQTVDVGSHSSHYIPLQARKIPGRKYALVDPKFNSRANYAPSIGTFIPYLRGLGVRVRSKTISKFLGEMVQKGWKTRHFNIDMPLPWDPEAKPVYGTWRDSYDFKKWFQLAPKVLVPNGKIFISSERSDMLGDIASFARQAGLKVRELKPFKTHSNGKPIPIERYHRLTPTMRFNMDPKYGPGIIQIFRIEITLGLKKAIPEKANRRNWAK